ncbi:MAG: endonuclease III domain-containing protein [Myxococcota bacterium]
MKEDLKSIYHLLRNRFGYQNWWPGETVSEIAIGAILTQNTSWKNVERAIANLNRNRALSFEAIGRLPERTLAKLIRPSGYYNQKAKKLKRFAEFVGEAFSWKLEKLGERPLKEARELLLSINGVGRETADSILLYALSLPTFVIDAYTLRIFTRLGFFGEKTGYEDAKRFFEERLKPDVSLYNDYHAQLVALGKDICKKREPLCDNCPLKEMCKYRFTTNKENKKRAPTSKRRSMQSSN